MYECVGITEKAGSFTDEKGRNVEYDNVLIYFVTDENPEVMGFMVREQKCSKKRVAMANFDNWNQLVGKQFEFVYNIFGAVPTLSGVRILAEGCAYDALNKAFNGGK